MKPEDMVVLRHDENNHQLVAVVEIMPNHKVKITDGVKNWTVDKFKLAPVSHSLHHEPKKIKSRTTVETLIDTARSAYQFTIPGLEVCAREARVNKVLEELLTSDIIFANFADEELDE